MQALGRFPSTVDRFGFGRGNAGRAATPSAFGDSKGSGARSRGRLPSLLVVLALAISAFAITAAPASADQATPTMGAIEDVSYTSVHLTGEVGPSDRTTYYYFQYSTDQVTWLAGPQAFTRTLEPSSEPTEVEEDLTGLSPGVEYFVRLTTYDETEFTELPSAEPYSSFTTLAVEPPTVLATDEASELSYLHVKATGEVQRPANADPAFDVNCRFEYITDAQFDENEANVEPPFAGATPVPCEQNPITKDSADAEGKQAVSAQLTDLTHSTTYHLRLVAENAGGSDAKDAAATFTTLTAQAPSVTLDSIDPAATSAEVDWSVNPQGTPTTTFLELATVDGDGEPAWFPEPFGYVFCSAHVLQCATPSPISVGQGSSPLSVHHQIAQPWPDFPPSRDLEPNTTYSFRLRASNAAGETVTGPQDFKTAKAQPAVHPLGLSSIASDRAILGGKVNPKNSLVTYQFEWGPQEGEDDDTYEHVSPTSPQQLAILDDAFHVVTAPITGLSPNTRYHYRLVATNTETGEEATGANRAFTTLSAPVMPPPCPNESSRVGPSAALPDCRAYEWASPGLNNARPSTPSKVAPDGTSFTFRSTDAVDDAHASEAFFNINLAARGSDGWAVKSLNAPILARLNGYFAGGTVKAVSDDFSQSVVVSSQPLAGPSSPGGGLNFYLHRADGAFVALTNTGGGIVQSPKCCIATPDFTHIFFNPFNRQFDSDPSTASESNIYEWVDGDLRHVAVLPSDELAPNGGDLAAGALPAISDSGNQVLFKANGYPGLYLRTGGLKTVEVSKTQRTVNPDPNPPADAKAVGITADGSEVLFTSASELTNDANTGETGGVANDSGSDLYSYDVASGELTNLTVDANPADLATGANVKRVLGTSRDAAYIYFYATGDLAPGAIAGEPNIYVEHEGVIDYIASASGSIHGTNPPTFDASFYVTPDGRHAAFGSSESLTGYDSAGQTMLYKYTYRGTLECASCRPSGDPPTAGLWLSTVGRVLSDDGSRLFFESSDAVVPQASNGLANIYEYEDGEVHLLSPGDGKAPANLLGASASGDDVFFYAYEELSPQGQGAVSAIYDVRVNADVAEPVQPVCQGEGCRGASTSQPDDPDPGTPHFRAAQGIGVSTAKTVRAPQAQLRVIVPEGGELKASGNGLKPVKTHASEQGSLTLTLALKSSANEKRHRKGIYKTKVELLFTSTAGDTSRAEVSLKFESPAIKKGGK